MRLIDHIKVCIKEIIKMIVIKKQNWVYYLNRDETNKFDSKKVGKWMYFFNDVAFAEKMCSMAVNNNIVAEAKHSNSTEGVCCFYLHYDDINVHKKVISFFLDNGLIKRTKTGRLYDMSFKLDEQTRAGQYGSEFKSNIKLSNFVNLESGDFIK